MIDNIISYREMCEYENVQTLQRGMNFRLNFGYSVILMSRKNNAIYKDLILEDWITIIYQWHDQPKVWWIDTIFLDQKEFTKNWTLTENWKFISAIKKYKDWLSSFEKVKVYEKIHSWVWSFKWFFDLINYKVESDWNRFIYLYELKLSKFQDLNIQNREIDLSHNRLISSQIKKDVWKRDKGECVICWVKKNLHFDHDLPFSKWWTSLSSKNIKLLCMKCNLKKSNKIE